MTDEVKQSYEWLLNLASGKGFASYLIGAPEAAKQAADLIEKLSADLESNEGQRAREIFEISSKAIAKVEAKCDEWKRRCEAAEQDITRCCGTCLYHHEAYNGFQYDHYCESPNGCSNVSGVNTGWKWRGPCEENGGAHA